MKKIYTNYSFLVIASFLLLALTFLIYFPTLKLNYLLIDDGQIIKNSREIIRAVGNMEATTLTKILFEGNEGRVRPAYWLTQAVATQISFYNVQLMHIFRFLILILSVWLIILILYRLKIDPNWIFFSVFLFIFNFQNFENYYRLGPTEIFLGLYYLLLVHNIIKSNISKFDFVTIVLATVLGCFTKETFFLVSLPFVLLFIPSKKTSAEINKRKILPLIAINILAAIAVFAIRSNYGSVSGYAQNYQFSFNAIVDHTLNYYRQIDHYQAPVLFLTLLYSFYWLFNFVKNKFQFKSTNDLFFLFFVAELFINLVILLPWQFVLGRYLIIVNISLIFVFAILMNDLWNKFINLISISQGVRSIIKNVLVLLLIPTIFVRNIFQISNFQEWEKTDSELSTGLMTSIAKNIPNGANVFVNYIKGDANIEIYLETGWHMEEFYNRKDLRFTYLDNQNLCTKESRYIIDRSSERYLKHDVLEKNKLELVDSGHYSYDPVNYGEVAKSFINIDRSLNWSQKYEFDWYIYKQKANTCLQIN